MPSVVVSEDLVIGTIVQMWQAIEVIDDILDAALEFLGILSARLAPLALNLLTQRFGHNFRNSLLAATRQFAGELLSLGILDVEGHGRAAVKRNSSFFLYVKFLPQAIICHVNDWQ
jgi:hypothetical protein